jgi:hypothetical protein
MSYLSSILRQFKLYKSLGEKAMAQVTDDKLFWQYNEESNSIAIIVKHLHGNMLSRWTDFLTTDGEKETRHRDEEFINHKISREALMILWDEGWARCLNTIESLKDDDLEKIIYIRNEGHTVMEAINRQVSHYPYHVGQIVFIAKMCADNFLSLSIPRNASTNYNAKKFSEEKTNRHFTDEFLKSNKKQD